MSEENKGTATATDPATEKQDPSLMDSALQEKEDEGAPSILDEVSAEEKAANDELMAKDDKDLTPEELTKKQELVKAAEEVKKQSEVPAEYEFKIPEGMELDQKFMERVVPIFKEAKLSQGTAQKLADLYVEKLNEGAKEFEEQQKANYNAFVEGLKQETIKVLGPNYKQELAFAARSRDRFASPELIQKLNQSGLANDKDMIALFIKAGRAISEDKVVEGKPAVSSEKDELEILYDKK